MTKPHLPFLSRNWKVGIQAATLGASSRDIHPKIANGHPDDHYVRPAKRRRFVESSPDSGIGQEIDAFVLHEDPVDIPRAMKINVLRLFHKDLSRIKLNAPLPDDNVAVANKDVETRARCKITITTPGHAAGDAQLLYCDSQMVNIRTSQDSDGVCRTARVELPQRFDVPEEKIYVERDDDAVFDLADTYAVRVELQSAGDDNWPPLGLDRPAFDAMSPLRPSPRHWTLEAEIPNVLERNRRLGALKLCKGSGPGAKAKTDFLVDIDVRWATALPAKHTSKEQERPYLASVAHTERELLPLSNGHVNGNANGHLTNGHSSVVEDELEEDAEGELTPGRSLRVRGSTNYNLKDLSAKAQGRAPRRRTKNADAKKADGERVHYRLPREAVPVREVVVDGFSCCICHAAHESLAQLRAHFFSHAQYRFELTVNAGKPGHQFDVYCTADSSGAMLRPKVYQLGRPTKPFDLDKYVEGDDSWVTSRLGPSNDDGSAATNGGRKTKGPTARATQRTTFRRREKKVYVPETNQPLFDPLSKAKLVPGSEVRRPAADESWLVQKHRDIVQDFCDVDAAEKEYIKEWDAYIQKRRIVSEAFIGRAVLEFVNEKINWLLESKTRAQEFGKHLTVLIARGLDEDTVKLVQNRLQDARNARSASSQKPTTGDKPAASETQPNTCSEVGKRGSPGCAVCGRLVRGPGLLICANESCKKPLYHDDCIRETAQMPVEHLYWRCNDCTDK